MKTSKQMTVCLAAVVIVFGTTIAAHTQEPAGDWGSTSWTQESPPLKLASFDGESLPLNKAGQPYISRYPPAGRATITLERTGGVRGGCVRFGLTQGRFYPQFNAHNVNGTRGFAREYVAGTW